MGIVKTKLRTLLLCGAAALAFAGPAVADDFQGLGVLPGSAISFADAVSANGSVIVGYSSDPSFHNSEATLWTLGGGAVGLGHLPSTVGSWAAAVSSDGLVVAGISGVEDVFPHEQAFRWTQAGGMVALGHLQGDSGSAAAAISADGSVIVGESIGFSYQAFRWTQMDGMVGLGHLPGDNVSSAYGVSADGSVVVGESSFYPPYSSGTGSTTIGGIPVDVGVTITTNASNSSSSTSPVQAFRWTAIDGMVGLGFLPGYTSSAATAVSADGNVIVGSSTSAAGTTQAFRWTQATQMIGLGLLPGGNRSSASAVNATGTVIVGRANAPAVYQEAVRWTNTQGIRSIASLLAGDGVDLGSWQLWDASGVSADGSVIVGTGKNPKGDFEAWIAKIGTGFLSIATLNESLQSVAPLPRIAEQTVNADLEDSLSASLQFGRGGFDEPVDAWSAWGSFGGRQFNGDWQDTNPSGAIGFGYRALHAWRFGGGAHWSMRSLDLPAFQAKADGTVWGLSATAAYEPGTAGPRAYASAIGDWLGTDITRGYLNGITPDQSAGTRNGQAYGADIELGWLVPVCRSVSLLPFAAYDAMRLELDPYTETTGAFPAKFDAIDHTSQISRAGAELRAAITSAVHIWASADWAHGYDTDGLAVTGEVIALNSPFDVPGSRLRADWAEGSVGASLRLSRGLQAQLRLSAASHGAFGAEFSANAGIVLRL